MSKNQPIYFIQTEGVNYIGALWAYFAQKSGLKVSINLQQGVHTSFNPELSIVCPVSFTQLPAAMQRRKDILKLSTLTPHLFYPRRVLMLSDYSNNNKLQTIFDILTKREREACALPVNLLKNKTYKALASKFKSAVLVYEYQFDRNRAIIELLKKAQKTGANLSREKTHGLNTFKFSPESNTHTAIIIENHAWVYPNDIRYSTHEFSIYIQKWDMSTRVGLITHKKNPDKEKLLRGVTEFLSKLNIPINDETKTHFKHFIFNSKKSELITEPSLFDLPKQLRGLLKQASSAANKPIRLTKALNTNGMSPMNHATFRFFQQQCDEKFDLAKQTGIDYTVFSQLYYRYPDSIDDMIEDAYALMSTTRDPQCIAKQIESNILQTENQIFYKND